MMNDEAALTQRLERLAAALERLAGPAPGRPDFEAAEAFVWHADEERFEPVPHVNRVPLRLLRGLEGVAPQLSQNTEQFARRLPANNALLWGARGMGKSSLVKAVHADVRARLAKELRAAGVDLKLVEIHREDIASLPRCLTAMRASPHRFIVFCAESLHYGGNLVFGADGYLYIGTGDGGEPNDASHQAQDLSKLHGKLLRINVNVGDSDPEGLDIPADNPFVGSAAAPEIWAVGLRNPWRFSLDDPLRGGTGALLIGDVGEDQTEEINYQPPGRGGRNYGWRNREGTNVHEMSLPPAFEPLTDPIYAYDHGTGRSVTGGFVYHGSAAPSMAGRYVFGDFVRGRVWSLALTIDPSTGEGSASDLREHTAEINAGASVGMISSFGVDASGELYVVNYRDGTIVSLQASQAAAPMVRIESPGAGAVVRQPFALAGFALDASAQSAGIATLHVWAFPASGAAPRFLGVANYGDNRPDVAAIFGPQFGPTGYHLNVKGLAPGGWTIAVYGWVYATQGFSVVSTVSIVIEPAGIVAIDVPGNFSTVDSPFVIGGWAIDPAATTGTGISTIHIWAFPADGSPPVFLGVPGFGNRPDITAAFGAQFEGAGYGLAVNTLPPGGAYYLVVYALSSVSGQFDAASVVLVTVR